VTLAIEYINRTVSLSTMGVKRGRKYAGMVARARFQATGVKRRKISSTAGLSASVRRANQGVQRLTRMIETKESAQTQTVATALPHNNVALMSINPFITSFGTGDQMAGTGNRIGDSISVRGLLIKGFLENSLSRSHVHYRIWLLRGAKGESFTRSTIFKGIVDNKIIDQMNTERFTVVASKRLTIDATNAIAASVNANGVPSISGAAGISGRPFSMWIPGKKFGRSGNLKYEDASTSQVKFYDYRLVILAYDWYGTPQDVNNVGLVNSLYTKVYYKDA